jgi:hypothetical protein
MSRFFKSAAFPILIVIVLAFFAQRLISAGLAPEGSMPIGGIWASSRRGAIARAARPSALLRSI